MSPTKLRSEEDQVYALIEANPNCTLSDLKQWLKMPEYKIRAAAVRLEGSARITVNVYGRTTRYNVY